MIWIDKLESLFKLDFENSILEHESLVPTEFKQQYARRLGHSNAKKKCKAKYECISNNKMFEDPTIIFGAQMLLYQAADVENAKKDSYTITRAAVELKLVRNVGIFSDSRAAVTHSTTR